MNQDLLVNSSHKCLYVMLPNETNQVSFLNRYYKKLLPEAHEGLDSTRQSNLA